MPQNLFVGIAVVFLHNLASVVWIGGMITLGLVVFPVIKKSGGPEQALLLSQNLQKRMRIPAMLSLLILAVTGILLARKSGRVSGPFSFGSSYETVLSVKHIIIIVMIIILVLRTRVTALIPGIQQKDRKMKLQKVSFLLLLCNIILGGAVLLLSSADAVLSLAEGK